MDNCKLAPLDVKWHGPFYFSEEETYSASSGRCLNCKGSTFLMNRVQFQWTSFGCRISKGLRKEMLHVVSTPSDPRLQPYSRWSGGVSSVNEDAFVRNIHGGRTTGCKEQADLTQTSWNTEGHYFIDASAGGRASLPRDWWLHQLNCTIKILPPPWSF